MIKSFDFVTGEVLLVDKQPGWTSFDVVNKIRFALKSYKVKVGHAGTLDPLATGLLIVCTGKMTKQIDKFQAQRKEYSGTMQLGITTPSFDLGTEIDKFYEWQNLDEKTIFECVKKFIGVIQQVPPIYSALKVDGERLYEKARRGESLELKPREVTIYDFRITDVSLPNVKFVVECSKGTYIRSLIHDVGRELQSGACLTFLRRERIGEYDVKNAMLVGDLVFEIRNS